MKKIGQMLMLLAVLALVAFTVSPVAVLAADPVTAEATMTTPAEAPAVAQPSGWDVAAWPIVAAILVPVCSVLANFFEVKEDDPPWLRFIKKLVNAVAINLSAKAGK